jgi:methanogenic corrinoid protein MtbC1
MPLANHAFEQISKSILSGNGAASVEAANKVLESGVSIEEIILHGILKAWSEFLVWHDRDPKESMKAWLDCFNATQKVLQSLGATIGSPKDAPFSVLVVTVLGEGHVLMRDIVTILLRAKGLKVYTSKRGVQIGDVSEALSDPTLSFVVLSCVEPRTETKLRAFVDKVREQRRDIAIIAGGPLASKSGADIIVDDPTKLGPKILGYSEKA